MGVQELGGGGVEPAQQALHLGGHSGHLLRVHRLGRACIGHWVRGQGGTQARDEGIQAGSKRFLASGHGPDLGPLPQGLLQVGRAGLHASGAQIGCHPVHGVGQPFGGRPVAGGQCPLNLIRHERLGQELTQQLAVLLAFLAAIAGVNWFTTRHLPMRSDPTMFSIPAGASLRTAAQVIESAGIDLPAWQLEILGRAMGRSAKIKAGSYEVEEGITALALLDKLTRGDVTQGELLLAEGKTFRQFRTLLNEHPDLDHDTLKLSDAKILSLLGAKEAQAVEEVSRDAS